MEKEHFLKRLVYSNPDVFKKYIYNCLPQTFFAIDKIPIECQQHGLFYQKAISHLSGSGCAKCADAEKGGKRANTTQDFIKASKSRFGTKFNYHKTEYVRKNIPVILIVSESVLFPFTVPVPQE